MTFVDTNVFMYAVGLRHPLRAPSRGFFEESLRKGSVLVTSAEVLQELLHAYLPVNRLQQLDAALTLVEACVRDVWAVEQNDVRFARMLINRYPELSARDLLHTACCKRWDVNKLKTFDRRLGAIFK